ncbi:MAG: diguanylate cyclase [Roseibium sp.]|nr:diguanylate cyclase [Roseibium sp.]
MEKQAGLQLDFEATFGPLAEIALIADADRRIVFINKAASDAFGYTLAELSGKPCREIYLNSEDFGRVGELAQSGDANRSNRRFEFRRKNGEIFSAEVMITPLYGIGTAHAGFLFIARDMSDQLALETIARDAASTLEDAIESISEGFALYDKDDRLVICNNKYREIYSHSAEAIVPGATFRDILSYGLERGQYNMDGTTPEKWLEERLARHLEADGSLLEQNLSDGRWLQIAERRTRTGGIAGIRTEITDLKTAEAATRAAYDSVAALANSLSCSLVESDKDGVCLYANDLAAQWFATEPSGLVGSRLKDRFHNAESDGSSQQFKKALAGERSQLEITMTFPDGIRRDVFLEYIPKRDARGNISGVITFAIDITDRKATERTLADLYAITSTRELSQDEKINQIIRLGCAHFDLPFGIIGHIIDDRYTVVRVECPNGEIDAGRSFSLGETYCAHTVRADAPVAINHTAQSELAGHPCYGAFGLESYIGAPILVDGERYGTVNFTSPTPRKRPFTQTDIEIIRQFADWIGHEIARQKDHEALMHAQLRLERIASTDDLTGISNRRAFLERAATEVARFRRTHQPFTAVMMDIDHFKSINDTYGHATGDAVLKQFAETVGGALRAIDVFGRLGGEEFCMLLHNTQIEEALVVAERVREMVTDQCRLAGIKERITCSMGLAIALPGDVDFSSILHRADNALYDAKASGRNCCAVNHEDATFSPR